MRAPTCDEVARATYDWRNGACKNALLVRLEEEAAIEAAESGADREPGYDIAEWTATWIEKWLRDHRETPAALARRILLLLYENTESWDEEYIGTEAAYLVMAVLAGDHPPKKVLWVMEPGLVSRYDGIFRVLRSGTEPWDPVWDHITVAERRPNAQT